jgi:hypothetical protein
VEDRPARALGGGDANELGDDDIPEPLLRRVLVKGLFGRNWRFFTGMQGRGQAKSCPRPGTVSPADLTERITFKRLNLNPKESLCRTGAIKAVIEIVPGSDSIATLLSSARTFCIAGSIILSSIASADGDDHMFDRAGHWPQNEEAAGTDWQIKCVAPGKAGAINLTMTDSKIRFALRRGVTSFIIHLAAPGQRRCFTLENENMAAKGSFSIATSNERLAVNNPKWNAVAGAIPFRHKRHFDLSLMGVEAKFVKLTFHVDDPRKIRRRDEPGRSANRFTVQP